MPIYGPDAINFDGVNGHRYSFQEPFSYTGVADSDQALAEVEAFSIAYSTF